MYAPLCLCLIFALAACDAEPDVGASADLGASAELPLSANTQHDIIVPPADPCADELQFPDAALEAAVRAKLGIAQDPLFAVDLQVPAMASFSVANSAVVDLSGLECAGDAIVSLDITNTDVSGLEPVAGLTALENLLATNAPIADLTPLVELDALRFMRLGGTQVTDIAALAGKGIQSMDLSNTAVVDFGPVATWFDLFDFFAKGTSYASAQFHPQAPLRNLQFPSTPLSDISALAGRDTIQTLNISSTAVDDIGALDGFTALRSLSLVGVAVTDWSPLASLDALDRLTAGQTSIDLAQLAQTGTLTVLNLNGATTTDLSPLAAQTGLVNLQFHQSQVSDLSPLWGLPALTSLDMLSGVQISDITGLDLPALTNLRIDNTGVTDIDPVIGAPGLRTLRANAALDYSVALQLDELSTLGVGPAFDCAGQLAVDLAAAGVSFVGC